MEMSKKEFTEHLNEFMDYMRRMEKGMSQNWDLLTQFQQDLIHNSKDLIEKITSDERITDLKIVIKDIKDQINRNEKSNLDIITTMQNEKKKLINDMEVAAYDVRNSLTRILLRCEQIEVNLREFSHIEAESMATRGAKKALDFVKEYKEAKVFMQSVRNIIDKEKLTKMESITGITYHPDLDKPIGTFEFSVRTQNVITYGGMNNMGDVLGKNKRDFLKLRNAGRRCLTEVQKWFTDRDLEWS